MTETSGIIEEKQKEMENEWIRDKRSEKQHIERHTKALSHRLEFLEKRRTEKGICNSYDKAEIATLRWVMTKLEDDKADLDYGIG
jgi:hypothetical protein